MCPSVETTLLAMLISTQVKLARLTSVRFIDFWVLTPGYISIKILSQSGRLAERQEVDVINNNNSSWSMGVGCRQRELEEE